MSRMRASRMRQRIGRFREERHRLENENLRIRDMIKGTVIKHYKKCGRKVCICREGKLHGPYWYLSFKEAGKSNLKYINIRDLPGITRLAGNYKRFQSNITKINRINKQIGELMGKIREALLSRRK
ncbi:MAG: hypothetical protein DDT42_01623 [candidate division WS2 bacterium]|uniref:DUF6788 domain-containing protein n=1 Tax=Psychracetigena formicireducens TaxID=2986056 RepID=A0A9E2BJ26_PSYF1|nr:hypothetical protein [Candidatus Psychracetigena formicireducens]